MYTYIFLVFSLTAALLAETVSLQSDNIHIHYPGNRQELATFISNTIQAKLPMMQSVFGKNTDTINIYLVDKQSDFENTAGTHLPDWSGAVTILPRGIIILKNPRLTNTTLREFQTTIEHEFIHLYQSSFVPLNATPAWFNEGWAQYASNPYNIQGRVLLSKAIANEQLIPLWKLTDFLHYNQTRAQLAYIESLTLIEFLTMVYGEQIITELFTDIQQNKHFEMSFRNVTGSDLETFERNWKKYIAQRYRWIFLLDIQYIIWLIIPLLVVVAYFIKGRRNKKIIHQWNTEDINNDELT